MSYVEHGPRIFLAGRPNTGTPLTYGDYVLPRKRVEGRLKLHDSCSDIRAWSPNALESSRYFRELNEHGSPICTQMGKIIPFNVVVDNIIRISSQRQNELQITKKELKRYKSLELTSTQKEQLENSDRNQAIEDSSEKGDQSRESILKDAIFNISTPIPMMPSNFSVRVPSERYLKNDKNDEFFLTNQSAQLYSYPLNAFRTDSSLNNYALVSPFAPPPKYHPADYSEKTTSWVEYIDVALQVERETHDVGVQFDEQVVKYLNKVPTASVMSQTSFMYKSSESNSDIEPDKSSLQTNNHEELSFECDASCSESIQDTVTLSESDSDIEIESDFDIRSNTHKGVIIQKDSEIIVLKNELCVKDAELEELREINKNLEIVLQEKEGCINTQQGNLKILHETLVKLDHQRNYEVDDLKNKFYSCKQLMEQLKQELNTKCESYYLQSQKIESYVGKVNILESEKESLLEKLQDMEEVNKKAEKYNLVLEQLQNTLQKKKELLKQNYEQSCILADQGDEIKRLLILIEQTSVTYEEQKKTMRMLEKLKDENHSKTITISKYEERLHNTRQEISDFFNNLKHILNNLEESNQSCDNCEKCDVDINEEANNVLCNINILMTRFQNYKEERQNLLQKIEDLKQYTECDRQQNLNNMLCEDYYYESESDTKISSSRNSIIALDTKPTQRNTNQLEFGDTVNSQTFLNKPVNNECYNYGIKIRRNSMDEVEKEIIECVTHSLKKIDGLHQKLQVYADVERPSMIQQIYSFYELLKDAESAINASPDMRSRKIEILKLYHQHREKRENCKSSIKQLPYDLSHVQNMINEFIEVILYQLLDDIECIEKLDHSDKHINRVFEIHLRSCINRINVAVHDAENRRMQITEEIEKQQKELQAKNAEIAQLKEEVAQHLACRGEGDYINQEQSNIIAAIKEELAKLTTDANEKDSLISKLKEQLNIIKNELSTSRNDCNILKKQNKDIDNTKNRILREYRQSKEQLNAKNEEIKHLTEQLDNLSSIKNLQISTEDKMKRTEKKLSHLEIENSKLKMKLSAKSDETMRLKNVADENEMLSHKIVEYKNITRENHSEITKLKSENELLSEKCKHAESTISELNQTIVSFTEKDDKIDVIYMLQEDLEKLDKNKRKLKSELNNLKSQLVDNQNNNKKLDNNLDTFLRENESLVRKVEYWKNENSELSMKLCNQNMEEKLRNSLYALFNRISEKITLLGNQIVSEEYVTHDQSTETTQIVYEYGNENMEPVKDDINQDLMLEYKYRKREVKENEIEDVENQQLLNNTKINNEMYQNAYTMYGQLNSSENNNLRIEYTSNRLIPENQESQNEKMKLLEEIEIRNSEIQNFKETVNRLTQENAYLCAILKSQIEDYQDKLILMKKNYDSSLHALCERHKESVETLQKRFEDVIKDERIFEPENWLQTLSVDKLTELYEQISVIIDSNRNLIHMKEESKCFYKNDIRSLLYADFNKTCEMQISHKNICQNDPMSNKFMSSMSPQQTNTDLQNQNLQKQIYRCPTGDKSSLESGHKYEKEKEVMRDNTFDQQRWNFINECIAYHKLSNIYEYPKSIHKD